MLVPLVLWSRQEEFALGLAALMTLADLSFHVALYVALLSFRFPCSLCSAFLGWFL